MPIRLPTWKTINAIQTSVLWRSAAIFLIINATWETFQVPLYTLWKTDPWPRIVYAVLHCTAGDGLIGGFALAISLRIVGSGWPGNAESRRRTLAMTVLLGTAYTIWSEWMNVNVWMSWAYSDYMPVIPVIGTGVSPLVQWLVLPALSLSLGTRRLRTG
jgi:hypothetical protein